MRIWLPGLSEFFVIYGFNTHFHMYEDIKEKAKKKVEEKKGFYVLALIFLAVSIVLAVLSFMIGYPASFWIRFPILVLALLLGVFYLVIFGFPYSGILTPEWEEEEMEKEMFKQFKENIKNLPPADSDELSEEDRLELKELARLKRKWENREDYV